MAVYIVNPWVESELFAEWVLADLTEREASGKRPEEAMIGFWMARSNLPGRRRLSDIAERRYVAISALVKSGRTMDQTLALVCRHLRQETAEERESIRTAYYAFKKSGKAVSMDIWRGYVYSWAEWILTVGPAELKQVSADYFKIGKQNKATWFSGLMQRFRYAAIITHRDRVLEAAPTQVIPPSQ